MKSATQQRQWLFQSTAMAVLLSTCIIPQIKGLSTSCWCSQRFWASEQCFSANEIGILSWNTAFLRRGSGFPVPQAIDKTEGVVRTILPVHRDNIRCMLNLRGGGVVWREFFSTSSAAANTSIYVCFGCGAHIAASEHVISRTFQGRSGPAFLFEKIINYQLGPEEDRVLVTGLHTVADIHCRSCMSLLGWRYGEAFEPGQRYKEGKFTLEKAKILAMSDWEPSSGGGGGGQGGAGLDEEGGEEGGLAAAVGGTDARMSEGFLRAG